MQETVVSCNSVEWKRARPRYQAPNSKAFKAFELS